MQKTKSTKHPLLGWILVQYLRILLIPTILYTSLNINKLVDIVHEITSNILDPSLTVQTQEQTTNQPQSFIYVYDNMTNIMSYISFGVAILAFMYASSFTIALVYHKTKFDSEYSILNSNNIEAYKTDVNKLTPTLFFILLIASIIHSKMG
jgi:hypothetical protein